MIFYLGEIEDVVPYKLRKGRNEVKSWEYGYDKEYDIVIISKDGTLGEIYNVNGISIGFPEAPKEKRDIINWDKTKRNQIWKRKELPEGLTEKTQYSPRYKDYVLEEIRRREEGVWVYLNGKTVYMPGSSYFFYQWNKLDEGYPNFRIIQNELLIYWEACKADSRCYGIIYVKNRRFGWTSICNSEHIEAGTTNEEKNLGMISKAGDDARDNFRRLVSVFKKLPPFFMPVWDGTTTPKTQLVFSEPNRKKRREEDSSVREEGLGTIIKWANTVLNALDGGKIFRSSLDETAKFPKECPFDQYWNIIKTSHRQGRRIVGKAMVGSTVNALKSGGREYQIVYNDSDPLVRNKNNQTVSGLYSLLIDVVYCLEGFFDRYGFSIVEDPKKPVLTDMGDYTKIGAITHWENDVEGLKNNPSAYNEYLRQNPRTLKHAFRDEAIGCNFNLTKIIDQEDHNEYELNHTDYGSDEVERGNFTWENGIQDTEVIWRPDPKNGRFWLAKGCHPPEEFRNKKEMRWKNGIQAYAPLAEHIGCFGVDPYNRSKSADSRGSQGAIHLQTKMNKHFPNNAFILEYIDRAPKIELFFEDVLMVMVYFSIPMLAELSNESFLRMIKKRGYRHFSLNNPYKTFKKLTPTERELGGIPANKDVGLQQFYAIEAYIEDYIGHASNDDNRKFDEIGYMPFNRTLKQWREVDLDKRTAYDAFISSSLAALGNQKLTIKVEKKSEGFNPFTRYDNSGNFSKIA